MRIPSIPVCGLGFVAVALFCFVPRPVDALELVPTHDAAGRFALGPLDKNYAGNLYVGPIGTNDFARTFLTFDLSGQSAAAGATTLTFSVAGVPLAENNTSSTAQTFTLYSLASDWDGTAAPGPDPGTVLATVSFTPTTGDDTQALSFSSTALTTAFNNALGGNLHLGIKSDVEGPNVRSFKWMASREDPGLEPRLIYFSGVLTEDFESLTAGGSSPPFGWSLVGVTGGTPVYSTSASGAGSDGSGGSAGLCGVVSSTTTPANTELPGAYLANFRSFSLASPLSGTFDFLIPDDGGNFDDIGFLLGGVGDGISTTSPGELIYARVTEGNPNPIGLILQDGDGGSLSRLAEESVAISNDVWYRATVSWTPTSGTTGDFSITISDFTSDLVTATATGFTFDSAAGQIGFGSINDVLRVDNVNFTGTPYEEPAGGSLTIKEISVDAASNVHLLLGGTPDGSYHVYRSGDLEGPLYRKRWSERFAGSIPTGASEVPLEEPKGAEPRGFYIASDTEARARIMCVGDSITEGPTSGTGFFIYRPALNSLLTTAGYRYEFVGSKTNTQQGVTLKHEGYSGQNATQVAANLATTFPAHIADIVLIHAGHNYFADIQGEASIVNEVDAATRSMIATCRTHNPDVIILLAQVITSSKLPKYSYIPALNTRLASIAADLNTAAQPVLIVNQADGWDPVADTVADEVHPTEAGAGKMANKWFAALQPLLD